MTRVERFTTEKVAGLVHGAALKLPPKLFLPVYDDLEGDGSLQEDETQPSTETTFDTLSAMRDCVQCLMVSLFIYGGRRAPIHA